MTQFFIQLLNVSIAASWLIGAVLLVRLVIKGRSPRWIACLLWGLVALRLVIPFSVESPFSLVPETPEITLEFSEEAPSETESIPAPPVSEMGNTSRPEEESIETEESEPSVPSEDSFAEPSEEPSEAPSSEPSEEPSFEPSEEPSAEPSEEPSFEPSEEPDVSEESYEESSEEESQETSQESSQDSSEESEEESTHESSEESIPTGMMGSTSTPGTPSHGSGISFATMASGIWLAGVLALAGYALVNYLILKKRVLVFVPDERGFRRCEGIDTPFVLGFFRPRIYLPYGLSTASEPYIIAHEKAHIKRMDHLVKPIAYCILALHWFNPLVWLAFVLFCKDIEYACDEKVLKNATADIRKEYATALLECASKRSFLAACPIAFGEVSVKERVKKTMNYKRPLLWVIIVSVLLCALVAVLFFTAPMDEESAPNTPSEEQTSSEASTELSNEESTESSTEESSVTEPSEPEESEPNESEPEASEPEVSEPEVSEPEVSEPPEEPVLPPTLEFPPEEELKAELQLRFDIGPGHTVQYGGEYYEFPEYATPMLYYGTVADGKGNFYLEKSKTLIRINDSKEFPYQFSESFAQVIFLEDDLYVHTVDGYVRRFDISAGFENGTLTGEWKRYERFNGDGSIRLVDGCILFRDEQGQYSTLDGELVEPKEPYTFVSSAEQVVTKLEDGTFAVHNSYDNWDYYIRCIGGEGLIIANHEADVFWTDTHSVLQTEYLLFDRNGELYSRLMLRRETDYQYQPCKIECGTCTIEYYHPKTLYFNGMVFEDVIFHDFIYGDDGTVYLRVLYPHYGEIYAITGGVTHEEFLSSEGWMDDIDDLPILVSIDMMKRDALLEFLADPRTYSFRGGWDIPVNGIPGYPTLNYERFYLKPDLLEIATDHSAMEAFLKKRGITCDVPEIHLFEAAITPFTLFVKTGDGTLYFIGVEYSEDVHTYTLYTEEEYLAAYYPYPLTIMVDGKKLETDDPFVTYGGYAELPLVAIMEALGAQLEWKYDDYVGITWGGNQCWIDTDYSSLKYGEQRFHAVMDRYSLYKGNDVAFRSDVLQSFFDVFCPGVEIRVEIEENTVYVEKKVHPEKETTMELVDEIPVNDPRSPVFLQYNIGESFYGQIITPTRFLVDLNGDIYCVVGAEIFRLQDSEGFRLIDPNDTEGRSVNSVAVYNGTIYVAYKSSSGQKGELVAYDITGKVLSSAALPAAKYGEYYYLFISEDGKPKVLFGNDIYSRTGQKVGVLNAEADVTYGVTIGGVTHSMTNEPLILSRLGDVSTVREIQEKWYGTDPAKRHRIREEIFYQYDKAGNLVSEFKLTEFSCGKDIPCHVAIGEAVCTSVSLETVTIGENVFEGVYSCRVVPGADGKLYAILIYTDGTRIYRIDPGYSDVEFRDLDAIENPKAECLICKAPAPAEKETTLEKVFTFDIGPNGVMEYNFFFEDDPSKGNIGFPGDFFADADGNYYFAENDRLIRLNDGAVLPKRCVNHVIDVEICGNTLYMLDSIGTVYQLDISNGFATATQEAEYPVFRYGYDSAGSLIRYGDNVLYQSREGILYTLDKTELAGDAVPYRYVTGNEAFVTPDGESAALLINREPGENISVRAITSAGISITDYTERNEGGNADQAVFSTYDLSGKATSRFMMTTVYQSEAAWGRVEFHYGDGLKTTIVYRTQDVMVGEKIFEDVLRGRMYCGMDGNFYFVAYHVNRADVYLVNAG